MPIYARLPYENVIKIRERFAAGEPAKAIAPDFGLTESTVYKYTADLPQQRPRDEARRIQILEHLANGNGVREAACLAGCSVSIAARIVFARDAAASPPRVPTPEEIAATLLRRAAAERARRAARTPEQVEADRTRKRENQARFKEREAAREADEERKHLAATWAARAGATST